MNAAGTAALSASLAKGAIASLTSHGNTSARLVVEADVRAPDGTPLTAIGTELSVVAAVLGHWEVVQGAVGELPTEDIVCARSRATLRAVRALEHRGESIDVVTVASELERSGIEGMLGEDGALWLGQRAAAMVDTDPAAIVPMVRGWVSFLARLAERRREHIDAEDATAREDAEIDEQGMRDAEAAAQRGSSTRDLTLSSSDDNRGARFQRCPDLVAAILARAGEEFVSHTLGGAELYRLRLGAMAILTGAPGTGKTSLATGVALEHARNKGPVVFLSLEMDADELGARAIGMQCCSGWEDALCGRVARTEMSRALALPKLLVLDGEHSTLQALESAVEVVRGENPGEPVMVVIDYLQILPSEERDMRARVAAGAQAIRRLAKRLRVVALVISQPSRAAGKALSSGELLGADSMTANAESAEIERAAYITLALGSSGPEREDGTRAVDLNVGKARMGGGDRVVPLSFDGRTGRMRVDGDARPAAEVKAERTTARNDKAVGTAALAIRSLLTNATEPMSRRDIRGRVTGTDAVIRAAVASLVADSASGVVEVEPRKHNAYPVWTRERAAATGRIIREDES
ncbi:MAG: DnaB-like helicase C-terminal domain-containing protein [Kofleriaceae bacterium]